jgi:hypothetical protein
VKLDILHQLYPTFNEFALGVLKKVATLTSDKPVDDALAEAFRVTNHSMWYETHPPALAPELGHHRPTSLGDVVVIDDQEAHQRGVFGWRKTDIALVRILIGPPPRP